MTFHQIRKLSSVLANIPLSLLDCRFPNKKLANGLYHYESLQHVLLTMAPENYLLRFRCSPGFIMKGSKAIACISSKWTDKVPSCLSKYSSEIQAMMNMNMKN
ncbi:hypothetical protein AVEN_108867-1 [Araneus ventricosus]|uniref:Sushi domain-containing protein n=1 Tax=Araneus ventricosus TaxID=182803 RepID=A0A4Y2M950_ARAVE|nr:hypothetical protein AVEN_77134-1 [Araneus ventricosus]GBN22098.1 hypothetical protein AVEN_112174-1 [Araneus ventricosus]GBN22117.1 hypothetical protein AVEN_133103-1 [Araneus ventricosus]GBN22187.1 hypothetical protein AVEN_202017-1 [Araneus ventricosus]GBN41749.1 hypothetical protein AVEN_11-1 [Araneus ventricosus]